MSCTIYTDETVTWGGAAVGGIRASHIEGMTRPDAPTDQGPREEGRDRHQAADRVRAAGSAGKWRERLFAVAEGSDIPVADAWAKVPDDVKSELGTGVPDQLVALEAAARDHAANDPDVRDQCHRAVSVL